MGVAIDVRGTRLCLRANLPPKPGSRKTAAFQQRIPLGVYANADGLKYAEQEAKHLGALLARGQFDWALYGKGASSLAVSDWITLFEADYFRRRRRSPKTETTWRDDYQKVFSRLPPDAVLSVQLLEELIEGTSPDTRTRKRFCDVLGRLAKFAGLDADFKPLRGHYSTTTTEVRHVPSDEVIAEWWGRIPSSCWRWAYGMMAAYGLRNHELFYLDTSKMPVLLVLDGSKTDFHRVYPLYPEWVVQWDLRACRVPDCSGPNNSALGNRVCHAFKRYGIPFKPYDLRHAWAVRSLVFGMPVELAAQQMGHSVDVHCRTYHRWISEEVHDRAYQLIMARADRPMPPSTATTP